MNTIPYETPEGPLMDAVRAELECYRASIGRTEALSTASLNRDQSRKGD